MLGMYCDFYTSSNQNSSQPEQLISTSELNTDKQTCSTEELNLSI